MISIKTFTCTTKQTWADYNGNWSDHVREEAEETITAMINEASGQYGTIISVDVKFRDSYQDASQWFSGLFSSRKESPARHMVIAEATVVFNKTV